LASAWHKQLKAIGYAHKLRIAISTAVTIAQRSVAINSALSRMSACENQFGRFFFFACASNAGKLVARYSKVSSNVSSKVSIAGSSG
jgi:hypothetical protein